ncbi:MAG TPA: adenosylmethionine decarboxylase [Bacteriovoracaceae bacterium]|nr:adenosylmethionine decarboxylase [Bacteriovoracaceae bacterium]
MTNPQDTIKLSGFNNLTKILSFNFYDFCIAMDEDQKQEYIQYIHSKYCAANIRDIARNICNIIEANILNESIQDYDPVGASTMTLMSDIKGGKWEEQTTVVAESASASVKMHLDKSHITTHTYPDASDPEGICTFRLDLDVATCGDIIPLNALNYMFEVFECDVVYIDYVVRGYTRLENGKKIYNDHYFNSIQDFIKKETLEQYQYRQDINIAHDNIWQTKLMVNPTDPAKYLFEPEKDINHPDLAHKMQLLNQEMREVFHLN